MPRKSYDLSYSFGERDLGRDRAKADFILSTSQLTRSTAATKLSGRTLSSHLIMRTAVYAIGREYGPPIKIGFSTRPRTRLVDLQIASPEELRFHAVCWVATKADATKLEAGCHRFLKGHGCHVRGEWFDLDPKGAKMAIDCAAMDTGCKIVPHWKLTETFPLSKDPLEGCFWT